MSDLARGSRSERMTFGFEGVMHPFRRRCKLATRAWNELHSSTGYPLEYGRRYGDELFYIET